MEALLPLIITFGLMWALLIRPQQRRVRQHQDLVATLSDGDEVITTGGIVGTIASVVDDIVTLDVAPGTSIRVLRSAIQSRIAAFGADEAFDDSADDDTSDDDTDDGAPFDDGLEEAFGAEPVAEPDLPPPPPPPSTPPPPAVPPASGEKA
jgi:preprotein translocase subunit YajC